MGKHETDLEKFLMQYPYLLRWVNECLSCHHKGYKPEMPAPEFDNSAVITAKLRRLVDELVLDDNARLSKLGFGIVKKKRLSI
jgi:hypothetical protein